MARANGLPTPKRKPPADTPERKLDAIARAVVNGGMDAAEAARRVNSVVFVEALVLDCDKRVGQIIRDHVSRHRNTVRVC